MTQNGVNALLNLCYDLRHTITREFPVSVTLRASLATAGAGGARRPDALRRAPCAARFFWQ
jgi:LacI family transcriptional regulator